MNKIYVIIVLLLSLISHSYGQSIYLKTGGGYFIPITKQESPEYFNYKLAPTYYINIKNSDFSIAEGFNIQGVIGYNINNYLSLEVGISYFANTKKEFNALPKTEYPPNGKTKWDYKNFNLFPSLLVGQTFNKSTININLFAGVGISNLNVEASIDEDFNKYSFDKSISYTYGYGIEYQYKLSSSMQLYLNMGINNAYYTPKHSELAASSRSMEYYSISQKEIDYVKEIEDLQLEYSYNYQAYNQKSNEPQVRIQETLKLNSLYWGIGIKYTLSKHEKK